MPGNIPQISDRTLTLFIKGRPALTLTAGELLKAKVVEIRPSGNVVVNIKGHLIDAKTEIPLTKGNNLLVQVETAASEIRLKVIGAEITSPERISTFLLSLTNRAGITKTAIKEFVRLLEIFKNLPEPVRKALPETESLKGLFPSLRALSGGALKESIESTGILLETKLKISALKSLTDEITGKQMIKDRAEATESIFSRDLKAILLRIRESLKNEETVKILKNYHIQPEELNAHVERLLRNIEYHQIQSRLNDTLQLFLPFLWERLKDGELIFRKESARTLKDSTYSCYIKLDLGSLGRLTTAVMLMSGKCYVRFLSDNQSLLNKIKQHSPALKEALESAGLKLGNINTEFKRSPESELYLHKGLDLRV